jgi:nucleotide-binding universal stress UspA family protein
VEDSEMKLKVLLAVDGSKMSNRAVDHVGDVVCQCKEFEVTLFHVLDVPPALLEHPGAGDPDEERRLEEELKDNKRQWMDESRKRVEKEIFAPAKKVLMAKGATEEASALHVKVVGDSHADVSTAIVNEAKAAGYDILVLGRRGKSTLKEFMMGSVVHRVVHQVEGCAVWVVE